MTPDPKGPAMTDQSGGHTPGRWVAHVVGSGRRVTGIYANGRLVAEARDEAGDRCNDANARLIAAAPTLLEALVTLTDNIEHAFPVLSNLGPITAARAAITLATGAAS